MPSSPAAVDHRSGAAARLDEVRTLSEQLPRFMRLAHAVKNQRATQGHDRAALVLLFPLMRLGALRQGALADLVHADPSTVSRHVGALVEGGLVRRVADEADGRASLLVVTDAGRAAFDELRVERESQVHRATASWSTADLAAFTSLFGRLLDDLTATLPGLPDIPSPPVPRENR
jgi:DNA-binding MarR family transcriptional regulator